MRKRKKEEAVHKNRQKGKRTKEKRKLEKQRKKKIWVLLKWIT